MAARTLLAMTEAFASLAAALHQETFADGWSEPFFRALLAHPGTFGLVAVSDDEAEGFILLRAAAGETEILTLAVHPSAQRKGAARALLAGALEACAELGVSRVVLEVGAGNAAARALYQGAGFAQAGHRPGYYPKGQMRGTGAAEDAVIMAKDLDMKEPG